MSLPKKTEVGHCKDCDHWAFMDKTIGECTLSELTRAESLHVAVVYHNTKVTETGFRAFGRTDDENYKAILETDASFGCVSFEPRRAE